MEDLDKAVKTSRAKRAANNKWDKENMQNIACKLKKEDAEAFKEYAMSKGKTVNALIRDYVYHCIGKHRSED